MVKKKVVFVSSWNKENMLLKLLSMSVRRQIEPDPNRCHYLPIIKTIPVFVLYYQFDTVCTLKSWLFFLGCKCCQWSPAFRWNVFWKIHQNEKVSSTHHSSRFFGPICHQQNLAQDKCRTTISLWTQCV